MVLLKWTYILCVFMWKGSARLVSIKQKLRESIKEQLFFSGVLDETTGDRATLVVDEILSKVDSVVREIINTPTTDEDGEEMYDSIEQAYVRQEQLKRWDGINGTEEGEK